MATNRVTPEAEDQPDEPQIVYITLDEGMAIFDENARRYLNMSGEEFLRRWNTGDIDDPDSFEMFQMGMLIPLVAELVDPNAPDRSKYGANLSEDSSPDPITSTSEPTSDSYEDRIVYLTREEGLTIIDEAAREYLNMSGEEFLLRWETGDFDEPDSFEVFQVGMLVPLAAE